MMVKPCVSSNCVSRLIGLSFSSTLFHLLYASAIKRVPQISKIRYASLRYSSELLPHMANDNITISTE